MEPSSLTLQNLEFPYTIPEKQIEATHKQAEFFIDGEPLSQRLKIWQSRPMFGRTGFEDSPEAIGYFIKELLTEREPTNQFGSNRTVLYRCHCGSDYCGVISCHIVKEDMLIHWLDIREEFPDDEVQEEEFPNAKIERITFSLEQYQEAIQTFLNRLKVEG